MNEVIYKRQKRKNKKGRKYEKRIPTQYPVYIKSHWWRKRKNAYYKIHGRKCSVCNKARYVDLHHKVYGNYGNENDNDLVPLCRKHHEGFHTRYGVKGNMRNETDEYVMAALFEEEVDSAMKSIV